MFMKFQCYTCVCNVVTARIVMRQKRLWWSGQQLQHRCYYTVNGPNWFTLHINMPKICTWLLCQGVFKPIRLSLAKGGPDTAPLEQSVLLSDLLKCSTTRKNLDFFFYNRRPNHLQENLLANLSAWVRR